MALINCDERMRLLNDHEEAAGAFDDAHHRLESNIGISSKDVFLALDRAVEQAWDTLQKARKALDAHIRQHGCS